MLSITGMNKFYYRKIFTDMCRKSIIIVGYDGRTTEPSDSVPVKEQGEYLL